MDTKVSFKSRIQFVDYKSFKRIIRHGCDFIDFKSEPGSIIKSPDFYTMDIRTCSGGGIVKPSRSFFSPFKKALGFHILNNRENSKSVLQKIEDSLDFTPKNCLLIGGKKLYCKNGQYSLPNFDKLKSFMDSLIPDFSFFRQQRYLYGQTHLHYYIKDDVWTLCSEFNGKNNIKGPANKCVSSLEDLIKHFRTIHIGAKDSLFIGNRQVLKSDAPDFFK